MKTVLCLFICLTAAAAWAQPAYRLSADVRADSVYADSVLGVTIPRLQKLLGPWPNDSLHIYIVTTQQQFDSLAGNAVPDWGAGVAIPYLRRIVIKSRFSPPIEKGLGELVAHEYAHIALARRIGHRSVPRWLHEGLAMYTSAEWGWTDNVSVSWSVVFNRTLALSEIERLNRFDQSLAGLGYAESFLAFKYFLDTYGRSGLHIFLDVVAAGQSIDIAMVRATGANLAGFDREFQRYLTGRYNLVTLIFNSNLLWLLLALVIIIGFILTRLRRKSRMKELDNYNRLHSNDFDYGEVEKPDEDKPWD